MQDRAEVLDIFAGVTGLVAIYPLLLAVNRMYLRLSLPWMQRDWTIFMLLVSPLLLLLSGAFLVLVGRAPARALGMFFLAVDIWWVFVLFHTDF